MDNNNIKHSFKEVKDYFSRSFDNAKGFPACVRSEGGDCNGFTVYVSIECEDEDHEMLNACGLYSYEEFDKSKRDFTAYVKRAFECGCDFSYETKLDGYEEGDFDCYNNWYVNFHLKVIDKELLKKMSVYYANAPKVEKKPQIKTSEEVVAEVDKCVKRLIEYKKTHGCYIDNVRVWVDWKIYRDKNAENLWTDLFDKSLKGMYIKKVTVKPVRQEIKFWTEEKIGVVSNIDADTIQKMNDCLSSLKGMTTEATKEQLCINRAKKYAIDSAKYFEKTVTEYKLGRIVIEMDDETINANSNDLLKMLKEKKNTHYVDCYSFRYGTGYVKIGFKKMNHTTIGNIDERVINSFENAIKKITA